MKKGHRGRLPLALLTGAYCVTVGALLILAISCSTPATQQPAGQADDEDASRRRQLDEFFVNLNEAATAGDAVAYQNLFLPDGVMFLPDRPPLLGREAIGHWFNHFRDTVVLITDQYEQVQTDIVGDVAIVRSRGTGRYRLKDTQREFPLHNKLVDILRYVDGQWRMAYHIASSSSFEPGLWDEEWEGEGVLPD